MVRARWTFCSLGLVRLVAVARGTGLALAALATASPPRRDAAFAVGVTPTRPIRVSLSRRPRRNECPQAPRGDLRPWRAHSIGLPVSFSIDWTYFVSARVTMVWASPGRPARPVRPMRWT